MAFAPMRSHSAPAVLSDNEDYAVIANDFETNFKAGNVGNLPVHGIFHPEKGAMLVFYPEGKTYAIAIAVDAEIYDGWISKMVRPIDFNKRKIIMCQ
jgi:hypothetical protein